MTVALVLLGAGLGAGCGSDAIERPLLPRESRYGILVDLVLHSRPTRLGGPFFLDRLETTRGDWDRYLTETERPLAAFADFDQWNDPPDPALPVVGVDQDSARAYAAWRFGRLPMLSEWEWAASAGGVYRWPWGDAERAAWANTLELGMAQLTPVGSFQSGRSPIGCYDLVGNAGEWTSTPWPDWLAPEARVSDAASWYVRSPDAVQRLDVLRAHAALRPWRWAGSPFSLGWLWAVDRGGCPIVVVAGYPRPLTGVARTEGRVRSRPGQLERRGPTERSSTIGVRVASDPATLLHRFAAVQVSPTPGERRALDAFLGRAEVREVLREALVREPGLVSGEGPVAAILRRELAP